MATPKVCNETIEIGTIFCNTHGYDMRLPEWLMVVKKNGKYSVTLQPLCEKVISGGHNGYWKSMPDTERPKGKPYLSRLYEGWRDGQIAVRDTWGHLSFEWDGETPLSCDDMD